MSVTKHILIILLSLLTNNLVAQSRYVYIPVSSDGETTSWYTDYKAKLTKMKLPDIRYSKDAMTLRVIFDDKFVTLSTNDYKVYNASITFYLDKILWTWDNLNNKRKLVSHTFDFSADDAKAIADYYLYDSIYKIPPADSLGWSLGFDGSTYVFEYSTPTQYTYKNYWAPYVKTEKIPQAKNIYNFGCYVQDLIRKGKYEPAFYKKLKPGKYTDGYWIMTINWGPSRFIN